MIDVRAPRIIEEEIGDLRRYLDGLPQHLRESAAMAGYHARLRELQDELKRAESAQTAPESPGQESADAEDVKELDTVVLCRTLDEFGLQPGDLGTVVRRHPNGKAFEVEFLTASGKTIAVLTLHDSDVRPKRGTEILHVRDLQSVR